jgi:lysophospholipase L1-like esterase
MVVALSNHPSTTTETPPAVREPEVPSSVKFRCLAAVAMGGAILAGCGSAGPSGPAVSAILPAHGPTTGGTDVSITGSDFANATSVDFGTQSARFTVVNNTSLSAVAPAGIGNVDVTVTVPGDAPMSSSQDQFSYRTVPTVRAVKPATGPSRGGTRVLVQGTGFGAGSRMLVGHHPARVVEIKNPDALYGIIPPGFGMQDVRVVTSNGASVPRASVQFHYRSRVLVIGDSLGIDLDWGFTPTLPDGHYLSVIDDAVGSTGLVRSDFYNWPKKLKDEMRSVHPTVVVALFGANDQQPITTKHGLAAVGTRAWAVAYEARVRQLVRIVVSAGAAIAWVGMPRMGPRADVSQRFVNQVNAIDEAALRAIAMGRFVSIAKLFTTASGSYTPYVRLGRALALGRQPDEVHLTPSGASAIDTLVIGTLFRMATATTR